MGEPAPSGDRLTRGRLVAGDVLGKGAKLRRVPVPPAVIAELSEYLASRGLAREPGACRGVALLGHALDTNELAPWSAAIGAVDTAAGITPDTLYKQAKGFFAECATALGSDDPRGSARLEAASTH